MNKSFLLLMVLLLSFSSVRAYSTCGLDEESIKQIKEECKPYDDEFSYWYEKLDKYNWVPILRGYYYNKYEHARIARSNAGCRDTTWQETTITVNVGDPVNVSG